MKKQQRYLYVISPVGLGVAAWSGSLEIEPLREVPENAVNISRLADEARKGHSPNRIVSLLRFPAAMRRAIRQRLQRRQSGAAA